MMRAAPAILLLLSILACGPVPVQGPPIAVSYPMNSPTSATQSPNPLPPGMPAIQPTSGQRGQYVWDKMMEGVMMGGSIGGPYGAGGGLIIGLIAGLVTAESHFAQMNARIQTEQAKDRELEAQIERELERQRELETQVASVGQASTDVVKKESGSPQQGSQSLQSPRPSREEPSATPGPLASLGNKDNPPLSSNTPFRNVEVRDMNKDGIPDLWIYYNPAKPGEIIRQEEDTNSDGRVDTWTSFRDGKVARREADTNGDVTPDVFFAYEKDMIVREERDEYGEGRPSYRAFYQNARIGRVERDTDRDGRVDQWIYYDTASANDLVLREETDLNADGAIDLWSYYEGGRLVRRDVSATGLEIMAQRETGLSLENLPSRIVKDDSGASR
ncbi:MAG: hypothetical protein ACREQW_15565 [Candidatus Binatia bacterium]